MVRVDGLRFAYDDERPLLDGVAFDVSKGEALAVVGPPGAGKSTLLQIVAGDLAPLSGTVEADVPVRWLVPAVPLDPYDVPELGATVGKDIVRFANEATEPVLVLSDEPDCVTETGAALRLYHDTLCELGERGNALMVATHAIDTLSFCERRLQVGEGGVVARRDILAGYAEVHGRATPGRAPVPADIVDHVGGLAVVDVERGAWLLTRHVRVEVMQGLQVSFVSIDAVTKRRLDREVAEKSVVDLAETGGAAAEPGGSNERAWWPGKSVIKNQHVEPRTAAFTFYVPPHPLSLPADDCEAIVDRFGDRVTSKGGLRAAGFVTDDLPGPVRLRLRHVLAAANACWWKFSLGEALILLCRYRPGEDAVTHSDWFPTSATRKLSATVQLSHADSYVGGDLELLAYDGGVDPSGFVTTPREQGSVTVFPAWTTHQVTPVESGTRWSLACWWYGPAFR